MIGRLKEKDRRENFRHLYLDIFWIGVFYGTTVAFLSVYAARLGADGFQLGLLGASPAVAGLLYTLSAGRWLESRPFIKVAFLSAFWQRLGYLLLFTLPWLFSETAQVWGVILLTLILSIPGTLLGISFNALFADIVPSEWRAEVVGKRNALIAVSITASTLISGQILDRVIFPLNYQIVFVLGGLGALLSTYYVGKLFSTMEAAPLTRLHPVFHWPGWRVLSQVPRQTKEFFFPPSRHGKALLRLDVLRGPFGLFMVAYLAFYTCQFLPSPLVPLFLVNELGLHDSAISLGTAIFFALMTLTSLTVVQRLSFRFGNRALLAWGGALFGLHPLILALGRDATLYWVASILGGAAWAMANAALVNRLMERVPEDDRPAHMALHNLALSVGVLAGSLLGPVLGDWLGLREALYITAALRLVTGVLFWAVG